MALLGSHELLLDICDVFRMDCVTKAAAPSLGWRWHRSGFEETKRGDLFSVLPTSMAHPGDGTRVRNVGRISGADAGGIEHEGEILQFISIGGVSDRGGLEACAERLHFLAKSVFGPDSRRIARRRYAANLGRVDGDRSPPLGL